MGLTSWPGLLCLKHKERETVSWAPSPTFHVSLLLLGFLPSPGGVTAVQCPKEESRSAVAPHETTGTKRTYDVMEGRVPRGMSGRDLSSASIEGAVSSS